MWVGDTVVMGQLVGVLRGRERRDARNMLFGGPGCIHSVFQGHSPEDATV